MTGCNFLRQSSVQISVAVILVMGTVVHGKDAPAAAATSWTVWIPPTPFAYDGDALRQKFSQLNEDQRISAGLHLIQKWGRDARKEVFEVAESCELPLDDCFERWARSDFEAALERAEQWDGFGGNLLRRGVFAAVAKSDPVEAARRMRSRLDPMSRQYYYYVTTQALTPALADQPSRIILQALREMRSDLFFMDEFLIIFCETGLVVTPFLPGDSLLFAVGALAANTEIGQKLNLWYVIPLMCVAGILGDAVNYAIGRRLGPAVFNREGGRFLRKDYLLKAQAFYEKHGGKAIVLARFVPIVRTFAPFVAGIGRMRYSSFAYYNIMGAIVWVVSLTMAGFFLGNIPIIKKNFEATIILIIVVSLLPIVFEWWKARKESAHAAKTPATDKGAGAGLPAVAEVKVEPTSN